MDFSCTEDTVPNYPYRSKISTNEQRIEYMSNSNSEAESKNSEKKKSRTTFSYQNTSRNTNSDNMQIPNDSLFSAKVSQRESESQECESISDDFSKFDVLQFGGLQTKQQFEKLRQRKILLQPGCFILTVVYCLKGKVTEYTINNASISEKKNKIENCVKVLCKRYCYF